MSTITDIGLERIDTGDQTALALGGITIPGRRGWVARVTFADGAKIIADRRDGEAEWTINGRWAPGCSMPVFWNGALARFCATDIADPIIADRLDAAVRAQ